MPDVPRGVVLALICRVAVGPWAEATSNRSVCVPVLREVSSAEGEGRVASGVEISRVEVGRDGLDVLPFDAPTDMGILLGVRMDGGRRRACRPREAELSHEGTPPA
ncbi:uncharacterized protein STAUR_8078 [Stigmatella aurantiaca DW4/3-1]|uniref:Uncharacterized protein n=1 Tax=Stigmatella aurantiaca (strain DW4/3-1) TaxID=378806 RepID=E3FT23_STIAD|nr:uncharacterized protein STAUR_8078 [Stigmatella aurantiaca DW4/3-1]